MIAVVGLTACVTVPSGPSVMVLPGSHKTFEQFQADGSSCQAYAQQTVGLPPGQVAAETGRAGPEAAIGAGTGLLLGSAAGSNAYGATYYGVQRRYDQAYVQCMYAKGNQVPVRSGYRGVPPAYMPPPVYGPPAG
ncbi:MAG: hypothetical protein E6H74_14030 [Betaproteobacteria bacterium]|nr:MAG: hypothetical protein E6H74_14030 [Betaproteobacteria bacterium]